MKSSHIRKEFLRFFESKKHICIPSSSLIPNNDTSILFTNAGMVQFKDIFTGKKNINSKRVTTIQKCLRAGGKHNDLENVGYTNRHHTFFEMLGNFSFGDYFKQDAIIYAWKLLTEIFHIDANKLYVTVYYEDDEAFNIWHKIIGLNDNRIIKIKDKNNQKYNSDNFWQMSDTGPCGPSSEIFYDYGPSIHGELPGSENDNGGRYVEIWNLVFMQFDMSIDRKLHKLPRPCVDTGMGLERISAVLQNVYSNYETDLFKNIINYSKKILDVRNNNNINSLQVIADHIRSSAFMIADNIMPSNEGRGYVLRRIIRRALRHAYKLGNKTSFFYKLVPILLNDMGKFYNELIKNQDKISKIIQEEENKFSHTLEHGIKLLDFELNKLENNKILDGNIAFLLYDTYGFPLDLTEDICKEYNISVDKKQFDITMQKQKTLSRSNSKFNTLINISYTGPKTIFNGYKNFENKNSKILDIYVNGIKTNYVSCNNENVMIILDITPFYAESGGQVGDTGVLSFKENKFVVLETKIINNGTFVHYGFVESGIISIGDLVNAKININNRKAISSNHSATHLLHQALCNILNNEIQQKGSYIDAEKLRFDFKYDINLTEEQIQSIEFLVNREIISNSIVYENQLPYQEAIDIGAKHLSIESYENIVRVISIGFSKELCGGTHVMRTGDIGLFKIISETSISSGIRRLEAYTGYKALNYVNHNLKILKESAYILNTNANIIIDKILKIKNDIKSLEKENFQLTQKNLINISNKLLFKCKNFKDISILIETIDDEVNNQQLKIILDNIKMHKIDTIIVLISLSKIDFIISIPKKMINLITAKELINKLVIKTDGKGGGNNEFAMGSGKKIDNLDIILIEIQDFIYERIKNKY
ncbi:Alanine--tRNA ligase [Candidatus Kinetoplastibacterium sorsogonicusi]|uniref:Alanine--tRNA ligase n=1 Tax=Candidatus Kinetoplastidibacterium kentomonadis TaxID=1576550 RepID=A0A3Q8ERE1_9PROT|nr:alanine--tRNA ligase [Candidatus Kinetoplastibacterium sorsogonicusi]AWD32502.1 Alanine--tRNA ligase [Candidatus Kinetoplastibacterium sorsogonicusi]